MSSQKGVSLSLWSLFLLSLPASALLVLRAPHLDQFLAVHRRKTGDCGRLGGGGHGNGGRYRRHAGRDVHHGRCDGGGRGGDSGCRGRQLADGGALVLLVAGARRLVGVTLRVAQLVALPRLLYQRRAVVLSLLPQRRGYPLVARPVGERGDLKSGGKLTQD